MVVAVCAFQQRGNISIKAIYIYIYMVVAVCAFQQRGNISIKADQVLACLQGGVQCCAKPVLLVA